jgi:hypothetical protein
MLGVHGMDSRFSIRIKIAIVFLLMAATAMAAGTGAVIFCVDRIEGSVAVLVGEDGDAFTVPTSWLGAGVAEGQMIRLSITPDPESTKARIEAVRSIISGLSKGSN